MNTYNEVLGGGGCITCCGYGNVPPMWVGFWAQNSLNNGPFFSRFSLNMVGLSRNWRKIVKNGWFSVKMGGFPSNWYDGKFQ